MILMYLPDGIRFCGQSIMTVMYVPVAKCSRLMFSTDHHLNPVGTACTSALKVTPLQRICDFGRRCLLHHVDVAKSDTVIAYSLLRWILTFSRLGRWNSAICSKYGMLESCHSGFATTSDAPALFFEKNADLLQGCHFLKPKNSVHFFVLVQQRIRDHVGKKSPIRYTGVTF